ncbi:MAG: hypothetical protein QOD28_3846 [Acidobacteriota bacterium]|nr:hypothetical protein [Acidobacteriota bacterium]
MSSITTTHVEIDEHGVAWIEGTRVKVVEVAIDKIAHGSSPEEIHFQYPHLSLAQIHAALAFYYDNQAELDADIKRRWIEAAEPATNDSDILLRQKLLSLKRERAGEGLSGRTYRKRRGGDTWHCCSNCSTWPESAYDEQPLSDSLARALCRECEAIERAGNCLP